MYEDAFLLIGGLAQNEKVIKEIRMNKKGFKVRFATDDHLFSYKWFKGSIQSFYELYDIIEQEVAKKNK